MLNTSAIDPRIGMLGNGLYYACVNGYDKSETVGSLPDVEVALGIRTKATDRQPGKMASWNVTMRFAYPAWDEVDGIEYVGVVAKCKSEAIKNARKQAENDGHACRGRGRYWFTAIEAD